MMSAMRAILLPISLMLFAAVPATAQRSHQIQADTANGIAKANAGTVGVISGGIQGTYIRIAADLASVLDDGDQLRVLPIIGRGSVKNIADILYLRGVDIGIVQGDVLSYIEHEHLYPDIQQKINYITKLYNEEVHVLARADIASIADLKDKPVNVDLAGSGTAMTASVVFEKLGVKPDLTHDNQATALQKLQQGKIAALVYVTGKPASLFSAIPAGQGGLHFLSIAMTPALLDTYLPSELGHAQYPALIADGQTVQTVAVGSVMAVYAWPRGSERYQKVARFVKALFTKFPQLQQPPYHPKWTEVNLAAQLPGWTRFRAAQEELSPGGLAEAGKPTQ